MTPLVALESTVIAHGLPHPANVETALRLEEIVRQAGAEPRTIGIVGGRIVAGMSPEQIRHLGTADGVRKVSRKDLAVAVTRKLDGATTVATTMWAAHQHGMPVFATGGIGGVHRGGGYDVSADLMELAQTAMVVVCAGPKAILDLPATREVLETHGVTVVGYGCDEMPAFYSRTSGLPVDVRCDTPEEVAALARTSWMLGLSGSLLVTVPVPEDAAIPAEELAPLIDEAQAEAEQQGLRAAALTPFLLDRLRALTGDRALHANIALLERNAEVGAAIALALADL